MHDGKLWSLLPLITVTSAPKVYADLAKFNPIKPVLKFVIARASSIFSNVAPEEIRIFLPLNNCLVVDFITSSINVSKFISLPIPVSPHA